MQNQPARAHDKTDLLIAVALAAAIFAMISAEPVRAQAIRSENFVNDSNWESYRSRLVPKEIPIVRQDFGWSFSNNANGERFGDDTYLKQWGAG